MPRLTPAVLRALDIMELFTQHESLTAPEVLRLTGIPRASLHELLNTLVAREWITREENGSFRLGVEPYLVGSAYAARLDLQRVGTRVAVEVASQCAETVNIGIRHGADVVFLAIVDSTQPVRLASRLGGRLPLWSTALGKAMLLRLPAAEIDRLVPPTLERVTDATVATRAALRAQLAQFAAEGICYETDESTVGVSCAAAPVYGAHGDVIAAISVSVPAERWPTRPATEWGALVRAGAESLSRQMGCRG